MDYFITDYHIQAQFLSTALESATLVSPVLPQTTSQDDLCVSFAYAVTSNVVSLIVGITYDDATDGETSLLPLKTFSTDTESSSSHTSVSGQRWSLVSVRLPQAGILPMRLVFVASKALTTAESQVVAVDNVTIITKCPSKKAILRSDTKEYSDRKRYFMLLNVINVDFQRSRIYRDSWSGNHRRILLSFVIPNQVFLHSYIRDTTPVSCWLHI